MPVHAVAKSSKPLYNRLEISDLEIDVGLYGVTRQTAQDIIDQQDSAAYMSHFPIPTIADHSSDGFLPIRGAVPGETIAKIYDSEGSLHKYRCCGATVGMNTRYDLVNEDGESMFNVFDGADVLMYTCVPEGDGTEVYVIAWEKADAAPTYVRTPRTRLEGELPVIR